MSEHERCPECDRTEATEADEQTSAPGERDDLCWRHYQGGQCTGPVVDWRARAIAA